MLSIKTQQSLLAHRGGFTLIEVMITLAIVTILLAIALPSYQQYVVRSSREAVQAELIELASIQDKIYLNSNAYTNNVITAYTGQATGGLGRASGASRDAKYTIAVAVPAGGASFTLTATPVTGSSQAGNGALTIDSTNTRTWADPVKGTQPW